MPNRALHRIFFAASHLPRRLRATDHRPSTVPPLAPPPRSLHHPRSSTTLHDCTNPRSFTPLTDRTSPRSSTVLTSPSPAPPPRSLHHPLLLYRAHRTTHRSSTSLTAPPMSPSTATHPPCCFSTISLPLPSLPLSARPMLLSCCPPAPPPPRLTLAGVARTWNRARCP